MSLTWKKISKPLKKIWEPGLNNLGNSPGTFLNLLSNCNTCEIKGKKATICPHNKKVFCVNVSKEIGREAK